MSGDAPARLRMFAGPNGSGKTTLAYSLAKEFSALGVFHAYQYINADQLQVALTGTGVDFSVFGVPANPASVRGFVEQSHRFRDVESGFRSAHWLGDRIFVPDCDSYTAAAVADFLREELLRQHRSFTFETVMSHPSKVEFFQRALNEGYRTYLYFVATRIPQLNVSRVRRRIRLGGHDVPDEKVVARYHRALRLLPEAMRFAYRAFFFDNSDKPSRWLGERTPEGRLILKVPNKSLPRWFRAHVLPHCTPES
jgi:predicted ABC-type ATPase